MPEPTATPTTDDVKNAIADVTKPSDFPGEFKLGDGTVVKAANWEEAFQKVAEMKVNTSAALRDREEQIRQRMTELEQIRQAAQGNQPQPDAGEFDEKKYWELANKDPRLATRYALASDLGVEPEVLPQLFNEMRNVSVYSADNMEMQTFMQRNPDWPGTDQASDMVIERLVARNAPLTADNLEYEYLKAVRDGEIEPLGEEAPKPFVPPNLGSGASLSREDANLMQQIKDIPDDKLDDFYRKMGLLK